MMARLFQTGRGRAARCKPLLDLLQYIVGGSAAAGCCWRSLRVPASGVLLQLFRCWTLPPARSCAFLLSGDRASCLCCSALLSSALEYCFKPKLKHTPPHPQTKNPQPTTKKKATIHVQPFPICLSEQGEQHFYREKEVFTAGFMKSRHHIALKKKTEILLHQ